MVSVPFFDYFPGTNLKLRIFVKIFFRYLEYIRICGKKNQIKSCNLVNFFIGSLSPNLLKNSSQYFESVSKENHLHYSD